MTHVTTPSEHMALLDIHFDEVQPTRVSGSIAADERHHQPWGIVSGGQYTTAIEAFATFGAYEAVKDSGRQAVGITNMTDFVRPHRNGRLQVEAQATTRAAPSSCGRSRPAGPVTTSSSPAAR